ncbi:YceI family protein [uncultured Paludibaculum sp.]|uniref:YceI family protein n=1 Tax=uncultured Paludibaculum sp. TaxID=1765020 RepID=UPI002AAB8AF7|nr:YceI family protein [uncultured Paludibaculum sp.]
MNLKSVLALALLAVPAVFAEEYKIDTSHSKAAFTVKHLMVSNVRGEFSKVTGTISYDEKNPAATRIDATIDATTVNTSEPKRDEHLRSADFFDVAKFPTMSFKSKSAKKTADGIAVTGDLTIHGVTRQVVLNVEGPSQEMKDPWNMLRRGATATTVINRADYGLTWNKALETGGMVVSNEVKITIDVEATRATAKN